MNKNIDNELVTIYKHMKESVNKLIFKLSKNDCIRNLKNEKWNIYCICKQKSIKTSPFQKTKCNNSYATKRLNMMAWIHIYVFQRRNASRVWLLFFSIFEEKDVSMNQYCSVSWHKVSLNDFETNESEFDFLYHFVATFILF